jgi:hypothetical protein
VSVPLLPNGSLPTTSIGVGCAYLTEGISRIGEARLIHSALDAGARHFDAAPGYGLGTAEAVLGRALKGRRDQVTIASKVGLPRVERGRHFVILRSLAAPVRRLAPGFSGRAGLRIGGSTPPPRRDFRVAAVAESLIGSLRRLQTDYLDLYLLHMVQLSDLSPELIALLEAERQSGRVRALGLATTRDESVAILAAYPDVFDVVQYGWSLLDDFRPGALAGPFQIRHRALLRALAPMQDWFEADRAVCRRLSETVGFDLADVAVLPRLLLGAALAANPDGITLVASRWVDRTVQNIRAAQNPAFQAAGAKLRIALASEPERPAPRANT